MSNGLAVVKQGGSCSMVAPVAGLEIKDLFNATANPKYRLRECVNMEIPVVAIIAEAVDIKKEVKDAMGNACGIEMVQAPRIVLIDAKGEGYTATSTGIYNSVMRIVSMFGPPENWGEPLKVRPKLITKGADNILTLELV